MAGAYELLKDDRESSHTPRRLHPRRIAFTSLFVLAAGTLSVYYAYSSLRSFKVANSSDTPFLGDEPLQQCAVGGPLSASPPAPTNIWASLTVDDTTSIAAWLESPERGLNLTKGDSAALSNNAIFHIDAYRPPKQAALAYLDSPSTLSLPDRFARVTIHHGGLAEPIIKDYLVGPLPISRKTSIRELTEIYHRDDIPYNARGFTTQLELAPFLARVIPPLANVTQVRDCICTYSHLLHADRTPRRYSAE